MTAPHGNRQRRRPPARKSDGIDQVPKLNCRPGDLAVVLHDEPTCASNIGHIVKVYGPMAMTKDLGATWLILPVGRRKWAVHNRDGTFRKMVVRLRDRIEHSDAWLMPLRDDDDSGAVEEEELGMDSPAVMRSMQERMDRSLVEIGAVSLNQHWLPIE